MHVIIAELSDFFFTTFRALRNKQNVPTLRRIFRSFHTPFQIDCGMLHLTQIEGAMRNQIQAIALASLFILIDGSGASALPTNDEQSSYQPPIAGAALADGALASPPRAFLAFCEKFVSQCIRSGKQEVIALEAARWSELAAVNVGVNHRIRPKAEAPGVDVWLVGAKEGDCDAYAIEKRKELIDLGWPTADLMLTVVYARPKEAHLVLTVRTNRGDYVLDNLRDAILPADATGYRYVMRQSSIHPRLWVHIDGIIPAMAKIATLRSF